MTGRKGKVAVVGDGTSVAGFRPLGFEVFVLEEPGAVRDVWKRLVSGEFAVVMVTEPVWAELGELAEDVVACAVPALTERPGAGSTGGVGQEKLDRAIVRALGTTSFIREEGE